MKLDNWRGGGVVSIISFRTRFFRNGGSTNLTRITCMQVFNAHGLPGRCAHPEYSSNGLNKKGKKNLRFPQGQMEQADRAFVFHSHSTNWHHQENVFQIGLLQEKSQVENTPSFWKVGGLRRLLLTAGKSISTKNDLQWTTDLLKKISNIRTYHPKEESSGHCVSQGPSRKRMACSNWLIWKEFNKAAVCRSVGKG